MTVNTVTGEIVEALSQRDAERLTTRIRLRLDTIADNYAAVMPLIREAYEGQAWAALGYRSHGDYVHQSFGDALSSLGVDMRRAVVGELTDQGMSTRAIAGVVGASHMSVQRDRNSGVTPVTPPTDSTEASPADEVEPHAAPAEPQGRPTLGDDATAAAPEREGHRAPASPPVVGIDGKTYRRPAPTAVDAAVSEFPDLRHFVDTERPDDAVQMAADLRRYRERGELDQRLDTLRRSIEVDQAKRAGTYTRPALPSTCHACGQILPGGNS